MPVNCCGLCGNMVYNLVLVMVLSAHANTDQHAVHFENGCRVHVELWWMGTKPARIAELAGGEKHAVQTFEGHSFEFRAPSDKATYGKVQVKSAGVVRVLQCEGTAKLEIKWETETLSGADSSIKRQLETYALLYNPDRFKHLATEWQERCTSAFPGDEARFCDPWFPGNNHAVGQIFIPQSDWEREMARVQPDRHHLIASQPSKLPQFTQDGYATREWPKSEQHLLNSILADLPKGRKNALPSDYDLFNAYVSAWESDVWVFGLPRHMESQMNNMIKRMLEEWCGYELEHTTSHGPRIYRNGSVLNMHVDRYTTHIVSAIVHLSHADVKSPWPLEIVDFAGNTKHLTTDVPGAITLYESAKLLHGRPSPFQGKEYVNIFLHFKPVGWNNPQQWLQESRQEKPKGWKPSWDPRPEL